VGPTPARFTANVWPFVIVALTPVAPCTATANGAGPVTLTTMSLTVPSA
jgi:hypothetical protein